MEPTLSHPLTDTTRGSPSERKVAVEVDGAQHLGDPEAYRRDRMKDILLQEQGYRVLRFLAEDVVQGLDRVLDTVLRVIARQKNTSDSLPM